MVKSTLPKPLQNTTHMQNSCDIFYIYQKKNDRMMDRQTGWIQYTPSSYHDRHIYAIIGSDNGLLPVSLKMPSENWQPFCLSCNVRTSLCRYNTQTISTPASFTEAAMRLTHWGWEKMAAIVANNIFKCILLNENLHILTYISLNLVPIYNNPSLFQIMARCRAGNNPLSEAMMVYFTDTHMRQSVFRS